MSANLHFEAPAVEMSLLVEAATPQIIGCRVPENPHNAVAIDAFRDEVLAFVEPLARGPLRQKTSVV
jgi:hypothetical protein